VPRLTRRSISPRRALPTALLVCGLAIPALTGCEAGQNAPTLEFHPAAFGAGASGNGITINNAFVLGPAVGQSLPAGGRAGVFLAIASANANSDTLESVSAPGYAASVKLTGGPVSVAGLGGTNLSGPAPRVVLTDLSASLRGGQTVTLVFTFANAGPITVNLPVEPHAYDYATYAQPPAPSPSATASATTTGTTKSKKKKAKASATASPSASASASATASPSPTP
jgi:copper(I)-binding protein